MQEDKVDILMATYNSNINFLKMQLDSLINQTYKNIQIIISDDASTNYEVIEVIKQYSKKDKRIIFNVNDENIGYIKNFENLLKKSTANYIMFCDHDDIWHKDKVQKLYDKMIESKVDLVYCNARQIDKNGKIIHNSYMDYKRMPKINGKNMVLSFSRHIAIGCSQIFNKKIKEKMIPYKESVIAHDWLSVYLASANDGIEYIDEPLFDYRLHDNNEFGGRSLNQNLKKWQEKNGKSYKSYTKYRYWAINDTFYKGAVMCDDYEHFPENDQILIYYKKIINTKIINFKFYKYFKYLGFKGMKTRMMKELVLFHLPVLGYFKFRIN